LKILSVCSFHQKGLEAFSNPFNGVIISDLILQNEEARPEMFFKAFIVIVLVWLTFISTFKV
jgi:hypothetical protein